LLLSHTFTGTIELRAAEWSEFDMDAATRAVPVARMKMGASHYVPLSRQALRVLGDVRALFRHWPSERVNWVRPKTDTIADVVRCKKFEAKPGSAAAAIAAVCAWTVSMPARPG
jgi:integrase